MSAVGPAGGDRVVELVRAGAAAAAAGDAAAARVHFLEAVEIEPGNAEAQLGLGMACLTLGDLSAAIAAFSRCTDLAPHHPQAWYQLGLSHELGREPELAIEHYSHALALKPGFLQAAFQLGSLLAGRGDAARAFEVFASAGVELSRAREFAGSLVLINEALALNDTSAALLGTKAHNHLNLGQFDQARAAAERCVKLSPDAAEAYNVLGLALYHSDDLSGARRAFNQAVKLRPVFPQARNNLGNVYSREGNFGESIRQYRFATNQFPNYADAWLNLAQDLHALVRIDEAIHACREVLRVDPTNAGAHTTLSWLLLGQGDLGAGWREFEWRYQASSGRPYLPDPKRPEITLPRPSSLMPMNFADRRVLLLGGGGIGTEIFFARFLSRFRELGPAWVGVVADAKAASLFQRADWCDQAFASAAELPAYDLCFALAELPLVLGLDSIEAAPPPARLAPLPERVAAVTAKLTEQGPPPYLGVTWRAGLEGDASRRKQVPLEALAQAIRDWPGTIVTLQRDIDVTELGALRIFVDRPLVNFDGTGVDLESELAVLSVIDQYLAVSNTNMYLAAAVDKTPWVLVKQPAEWRWCDDGHGASRWLPGARLLTEEPGKGWRSALQQLKSLVQAEPEGKSVINT